MTKTHKPLQRIEEVRAQINIVRAGYNPELFGVALNQAKMPQFERDQLAATKIISDMANRGVFFRDAETAYYLFIETGELMSIEGDGIPLSRFLNKYGLNATEKIFKYIVEAIYQHSLECGADTVVRHFAHLWFTEDGSPVLFIAMDNNRVLKVTPETISEVTNGTDGVLFLTESTACPEQVKDYLKKPVDLLGPLMLDKIPFQTTDLNSEESKFLFLCQIFSLFLKDLFDTNPIFAFIGEKGSGKTTAVRLIGNTLYGDDWDVCDVGNDQKDFDAMVTSRPFVCLDNTDEYVKWLTNKLAIIASGGKIPRRILFKTNRFADYPIIAMVATTSRTPCFRRDDVADRLVILKTIRLSEIKNKDFDDDVLSDAVSHRIELWAEIIKKLQSILKVLSDPSWKDKRIRGVRLQGFARFTWVVNEGLKCGVDVDALWKKQQSMQVEFASENENLFDIIPIWIKENPESQVTAGELNEELKRIARSREIVWQHKSSFALASRLSQLKSKLEAQFGMKVEIGTDNQNIYSFSKSLSR
ncbi:MAG TPA: hypothetical protein VGB30_00865 [bacterium]|jgi:hypothetical protein